MKVSTSGAAMSTPSASPIHQVTQLASAPDAGTAPVATSTGVAMLGLITQASRAPSSPASAMSRGAFSTMSRPTKRRTSAAPAAACSVAPAAISSGSSSSAVPLWSRKAPSPALTAKAPSKTPGRAVRP